MESYTAAFSEGSPKGKEETLTFRFEPFILAVECATLDVAKEVVKVGRETGFRESGLHISNRLIVSIRCSIRLELPVVKNGQLLVSKEYVDHITMLSCEKFTDNFKRIDRFHMLLRSRLVALRAHEGAGRSKETSHPGLSPDDSSVWAVQVDKRKAKPLKDFLKRQKWLHKSIKPVVSDGKVAFPLTAAGKEKYPFQEFDPQPLDDSEAHTLIQLDEDSRKANLTKTPLSPYERLRRAVSHFLGKDPESVVSKDYFETLMNDLPSKWERLGDALLIPSKYMVDEYWYKEKNKVVWETIASALQCQKIGRQRAVVNNAIRESGAELIWPTEKAAAADGHVKHLENGILFCFDFTKCMFSSGNVTEKARVAAFDCRNEVVVDMFAGIGYYTLPYLVKARAKHVYACEWNPEALKALRRNLKENGVEDKCTILEGDCTVHAPAGIANRVNLGLIPSSEVAWSAAVRSLRPEGGWLHVHMNCLEDEIHSFVKKMTESLTNLAHDQDKRANVFCVRHVEKVKWYAPKVRHIVVDIECKVCGGLLPSSEEKTKSMERNRSPLRKFPPAKSLEVLEAKDEGLLSSHISSSREPLLFRGLDVGQDNWLWTKEGLRSLDPSDTTPVSVHVSDVSTLDFVHKNFEYSKMSLQAFLKATETENVYLRCLGKDPRKEPASLPKSFPQLASVFKMPQVVEESKIFSTVLRVASEGLALWTHYDVMDNLLIQMHGRKRVLLFPPEVRSYIIYIITLSFLFFLCFSLTKFFFLSLLSFCNLIVPQRSICSRVFLSCAGPG